MSAVAQAKEPRLPKLTDGVPYATARTMLIAQGYRPQPPPYPDPNRCDGHDSLCAQYPELNGCSETQLVLPCDFIWRDPHGELLLVIARRDSETSPPRYRDAMELEESLRRPLFTAEQRLPYFRQGTDYDTVRREMVSFGFVPQPIAKRLEQGALSEFNSKRPRRYPEIFSHASWGGSEYLFRRVSDGRFAVVFAFGENDEQSYEGSSWALPGDLKLLRLAPQKRAPHR